ncbi:RNA helicase [Spironucleus salmonicida]|uniref:RNA helicase n=1 Tax=Spironucleus salmonicida TaxID=348837 RepID=V6LXU2_9EUKA|nr:RNA helicase [Spironucleus salmonicida]|eukprot:EST48531.1 RNA helicase [Spironucleus salmonicida]
MEDLQVNLFQLFQAYPQYNEDHILEHTIVIIQNQNEDIACSELIDLLGFDILDNGLLEQLIIYRQQFIQSSKAQVQKPVQQTPEVLPLIQNQPHTTQKQLYRTGKYFDFAFIDSKSKISLQVERKPITLLPKIFQQVFDFEFFNDLQSALFTTAYTKTENILVSAPTSSGKTNVAVLCIMQMLSQIMSQYNIDLNNCVAEDIKRVLKETQGLCVYLTPLKALASEITQKFKGQLNKLGFQVLECTGDENPPVELINQANILILTPEKFDVITRKQVNSSIFSRQKLLIIDEIHLIGVSGRGNVLESIVCRTKLAIEQLQSPLRFVGISATIPNYKDIAQFLECELSGTYVFDDSYRPVPMTQFVFGIKEKPSSNVQSDLDIQHFAKTNSHLKQILEQVGTVEEFYQDEMALKQKLLNLDKKEDNKKKKQQQQLSVKYDDMLDELCTQISVQNNEQLQSTMIFVHSRRKAVELAKIIASKMPQCDFNKNIIKQAQGCEKGDLSFCMSRGVGFHHSQIDKSHKRLVEDSYRQGELTIVVCTATLAWGVNLPAQTVVIRGTDIFSEFGQKDLDILDVKQIFGRAGRPQFTGEDGKGRGIILTKFEKIPQYMRWLANDTPIGSQVGSRLPDILNAEIVLGNISTVGQAYQFIRKSFYAIKQINYQDMILVSLQQLYTNQLLFSSQKIVNDPNQVLIPTELGKICSYYYVYFDTLTHFIKEIQKLPIGSSVGYDELFHLLSSIPEFQSLKPRSEEREELMQISGQFLDQATEQVSKLQSKGINNKQINQYLKQGLGKAKYSMVPILAQDDQPEFKVNCLIQAFISQYIPKNQSLISDQRLVIQSLPRVAQAFLESLFSMKRQNEALKMNDIVNSLLYQSWYFTSSPFFPLIFNVVGSVSPGSKGFQSSMNIIQKRGVNDIIQLSTIQNFHKLYPVTNFVDYSMLEQLTYNDIVDRLGDYQANTIIKAIKMIPQVQLDAVVIPISKKLLRVQVNAIPKILWNKNCHGYSQSIVILISRADNGQILHRHEVVLNQYTIQQPINIVTLIKISQWNKITVQGTNVKNTLSLGNISTDIESDEFPVLKVVAFPKNWTGSTAVVQEQIIQIENIYIQEHQNIEYQQLNDPNIVFQSKFSYFTPLPKIQPISTLSLHWPEAQNLFSFKFFNPIQSVMFHTLFYQRENVYVGAPTSSGKTVAAELAILQVLKNSPGQKCVYIAPIKALVREKYLDWKTRFSVIGANVVEITGDYVPEAMQLLSSHIIVTTPEKWDAMSRSWKSKQFLQLIGLIIIDEVHLIGTSRGYVIESVVARYQLVCKELNKQIRLVGLSTPSQNVKDIAQWLKVPYQNIFNFDNAARPVKLDIHIQGFIGDKYCERMELMNRPVYTSIKKYSPNLPVLIFVQSRKQTRKTAYALLNLSFADNQPPECFFKIPNDKLSENIQDPDAAHCIKFGVGIHHSGMISSDREIIEQLYLTQQITILVCTATLAAGINMPVYMTILKGCEYFDGNIKAYVDFDIVDVQQMCGRAGRPQYIQYKIKSQIKQLLGQETVNQLEDQKVFDFMYTFNKQLIKDNIKTNIPDLDSILDYIEQLNIEQPQSVSIIMCRQSAKETYKQFFNEPFPFESSLLNQALGNALASAMLKVKDIQISYFPDCVNAEISIQGTSRLQLRNWLQHTFFFIRARRNPLLYGIDLKDILDDIETVDLSLFTVEFHSYSNGRNILEQPKASLVDFFTVLRIYAKLDSTLDLLISIKAISSDAQTNYFEEVFYQTDIGKIASTYYISYHTLWKYVHFGQITTPYLAISQISQAHEFAQIPVRCDEEKQMSSLAIPEQIIAGSGNQKAYFVLTKQYENDMKMPTPEFNLDLRTVMASTHRITAALIEIKLRQNDFASSIILCKIARNLKGIEEQHCVFWLFARVRDVGKEWKLEFRLTVKGNCRGMVYLGAKGEFGRGNKEVVIGCKVSGEKEVLVFVGSDVISLNQTIPVLVSSVGRIWENVQVQ